MSGALRARWQPTRFDRFVRALDTSMGTAETLTDAQGELTSKRSATVRGRTRWRVSGSGTKLARWFGLATFESAILHLDHRDELPFHRGGQAQPGPAFVTRAEKGHAWGGSEGGLKLIVNPDDVPRLVVFDAWTLNCDRHPPDLHVRKPNYDNVFLSEEQAPEGKFRIIAMDHTHCFTCGRDLTERIATIDRTKDERVHGIFPGFVPYIKDRQAVVRAAADRLREFNADTCRTIVEPIPPEWQVSDPARSALCDLICQRATFVADNVIDWLTPTCWSQGKFEFEREGEGR